MSFLFGIEDLDLFLGGQGLKPGALSEWGMLPAEPSRNLLLRFLAHNRPLCLFSYHREDAASVYPPAWAFWGVDLNCTYFAKSADPIRDLKPLIIDPTFRCLILDCKKSLSDQELAFLSLQSRRNQTVTMIIRPYLLSTAAASPWLKLRVNCRYEDGKLNLKKIRTDASGQTLILDAFWKKK